MATTRETDAEITEPEPLGKEGEICAQCGTKLAIDQRYCLNCGTARAEPRLDYERHLRGNGAAAAGAKSERSGAQWSPLLAVVAIAVLGVMLLLGVLIGQGDSNVTVTQVPASTASSTAGTTATESLPTTTTTPGAEGATTTPDGSGAATVPNTGTTTSPKGSANGGAGAGGISPTD